MTALPLTAFYGSHSYWGAGILIYLGIRGLGFTRRGRLVQKAGGTAKRVVPIYLRALATPRFQPKKSVAGII